MEWNLRSSGLRGILQDATYAARVLRRQPRFAILVVLTMAVGIGSTTVLFSVTYGVLMKPLPWRSADTLVVLKETRGGNPPRFGSLSNTAYFAWRGQATTVEEIAAWNSYFVTLAGAGDPERIRITAATPALFSVLGVQPLVGSLFEEQDGPRVVVLSESLWRQRFAADPEVLGRTVQFDGAPRTVIGVAPDRMAFPDTQSRAWVPFRVAPPAGNSLSMFEAVAKLRPGVTAAQAAAEGTARGGQVAKTGMTTTAIFGGDGPVAIMATPLREALTQEVRRPLIVLLVAAALLLVIATSNVASLQLARATARRRELAIRAALGAGPLGAVRPLVIESLLLGAAGGAAGLGLAWTLQRSAVAILPADFPRLHDLTVDATIVLFTAITSAAASLAFGLILVLRLRRVDVVDGLAEDRMPAGGLRGRSAAGRGRLWLLGGQVAIACVLLSGASLLGRSFIGMLHADRGFDPARVLSMQIPLPGATYTPQRRRVVIQEILGRLERVPSVRHAAFTSEVPWTPGGSTGSFTLRSRGGTLGARPIQAAPRLVSAGYFRTLGLRAVAGRPLASTDTETSQPVAVVNETFARRYLGDEPLGARLPLGVWGGADGVEATIVGVIQDIRYVGAGATSLPEVYYSERQIRAGVQTPVATLLIQAEGTTAALTGSVRHILGEVAPGAVSSRIVTLEDRLLSTSLARPRLYAALLVSFAAVALLVTGVGLFGILSFTVAQRTRELGVRAALGARRIDLVSLVLREGIAVVVAGVAAGLLVSAWSMRWVGSLLYGVTPGDWVTYTSVPVVLLAVAALSCCAPAVRAARLDPLRALRSS